MDKFLSENKGSGVIGKKRFMLSEYNDYVPDFSVYGRCARLRRFVQCASSAVCTVLMRQGNAFQSHVLYGCLGRGISNADYFA